MAFPSIPVQIKCPQCQAAFTAQIRNILDVGQEPELKTSLLRGDINVVQCPKCEFRGMMSVPLLYHDPEKELALVLMSQDTGLPHDEQEKATGALVNAVMDSLPPEQRKGYLLQPQTLLSFQRLVEEILQADGISKETLDAQRAAISLIDLLLEALDDERFATLVEEHETEFTYDFYLLLSALIDDAKKEGQEEREKQLARMREGLLAKTGGGDSNSDPSGRTFRTEQFIETLCAASDADFDRMLVANASAMDYIGRCRSLLQRIDSSDRSNSVLQIHPIADFFTHILLYFPITTVL